MSSSLDNHHFVQRSRACHPDFFLPSNQRGLTDAKRLGDLSATHTLSRGHRGVLHSQQPQLGGIAQSQTMPSFATKTTGGAKAVVGERHGDKDDGVEGSKEESRLRFGRVSPAPATPPAPAAQDQTETERRTAPQRRRHTQEAPPHRQPHPNEDPHIDEGGRAHDHLGGEAVRAGVLLGLAGVPSLTLQLTS